jgi:hypothetical protein
VQVVPICSGCVEQLDIDGEPIEPDVTLDLAANDLDGDGSADIDLSISEPGQSFPVRRVTGDILFRRDGARIGVMSAGDLDGEPGDEMWVFSVDAATRPTDAYIVPYTAPAGTHDPAEVGVRVPPGVLPRIVDDRTGDGTPDLVAVDSVPGRLPKGSTHLLSTEAILATEIGGDARQSALLATIDGVFVQGVDLGSPQLAMVTADVQRGTALLNVVVDGRITRLSTGPHDVAEGSWSLTVAAGQRGRFVTFESSDRSGGARFAWALDQPCPSG